NTGNDNGGAPPTQQAEGGSCGVGTATIVINQPGLDKLNVRSGPGGQVVGTVPEGGTVSVIGPCGAIGGGGVAQQNPPAARGPGLARRTPRAAGAAGWCRISAPVPGCFLPQFLQSGGGATADTGLPNGAAGFAKSKGKPQAFASATATAGFSGRWSAKADNVA